MFNVKGLKGSFLDSYCTSTCRNGRIVLVLVLYEYLSIRGRMGSYLYSYCMSFLEFQGFAKLYSAPARKKNAGEGEPGGEEGVGPGKPVNPSRERGERRVYRAEET